MEKDGETLSGSKNSRTFENLYKLIFTLYYMRSILLATLTVWSLLTTCWLTVSCDDSDDFTADAGSVLSFSTDTINFDTVISTIGSATKQMRVFNRNEKGLRIVSARLKHGADSRFRVNIDGEFLRPETDATVVGLEVAGKDSLFVFAEVTMDARGQDEPFTATDSIIFRLESGVEQHVVLKAVGQDAYMWRAKEFVADTTLTAGRPFVVYDSLVVASGVTLTLTEGVKLYFHTDAELRVHGRVEATGTLAHPVVFRGDRTDRLFDYLPYDNTPSRWGGIRIYPESEGNSFVHTDIHSTSFGLRVDSARLGGERLYMANSVVHNNGGNGLTLLHCKARFVNTQISNAEADCVYLAGGDVLFAHCTLAQFYPFQTTNGRGAALRFTDNRLGYDYPMVQAGFYNCIITGYGADVLYGEWNSEGGEEPNFLFMNCLIKTPEPEGGRVSFVDVVFEDDKKEELSVDEKFRLFDTRRFLYDFRLTEVSPARNIGNEQVALEYPLDFDGINRTEDEGPDAGCFEYVASTGEER